MRTKIVVLVIIVFVLIVGGALLWHGCVKAPSDAGMGPGASTASPADYKNATYNINGVSTTLVNGYAETTAAPGSASTLVTQYFGNEATGDLAGNGAVDVAFLVTQSGSGSGTFYYVVAALKTPTGYAGTNAIFLGDRIAPQATEIRNGEIIVNYADRAAGEPMTDEPTVGVSKYFRVESGVLVGGSGGIN